MSLCEMQPSYGDRVVNTTTGKVHACNFGADKKIASLACFGVISLRYDNYERLPKGNHKITCKTCLKRLSMYDSDEVKNKGILYGVMTKDGLLISKNYKKPFTTNVLEAKTFKRKENILSSEDLLYIEYEHKETGHVITDDEYYKDLTFSGRSKYVRKPTRLKEGLKIVEIKVLLENMCDPTKKL